MRTVTVTTALVTVAATLLLVSPSSAGGGGHGSAQCRTTSSGAHLAMLDNCFDGIVHTVDGDGTLTITNEGELPHTITAADGSFDSGTVAPSETFELDLDRTGDIPIYCTLHGTADGQGMAGLLRIDAPTPAKGTLASSTNQKKFPASETTAALVVGAGIGAAAYRQWTHRRASDSQTG